MGAPLSLQTALLHHFHTQEGILREPRLVAGRDFERLRISAITDPLTGLYNRRFLAEKLSRHLLRAARSGDPVSVAIIDLQDFKSVLDRMRLRLLAGSAGFDAPVVNVGYGGLAFQARGHENVPPRTNAELSRPDHEEPRPVRIRVKHAARLPSGRLRVGCKYA